MAASITIEQSNMVTEEPRTQEALREVLQILETRAEHVVSVKVLSNFSIDNESTLRRDGQTVVTGLVVCVKKSFQLQPEDAAWFHPSIGQGRSVFTTTAAVQKDAIEAICQYKQVDQNTSESTPFISDTNCKFGEYVTSKADEFGCQQEERHLVVDTNGDALLASLHAKWLNSSTSAGEVSTQWKRTRFGEVYSVPDKSKNMRELLAETVSPGATLHYSDTVNDVLSDSRNIYFLNHAVKVGENKNVLMHASSLGGYRMYSAIDDKKMFFPATMGTSDHFYNWNELTKQNCARIEQTCVWSGKLTFNTQVMRPPAVRAEMVRDMENEYGISLKSRLAMKLARFSASDAISDKLSAEDLFKITPTAEHVANAKKYITTPLTMQHEVTTKLMNNIEAVQKAFPKFELFNSKVVKQGRLRLPHEVFEFLLKET